MVRKDGDVTVGVRKGYVEVKAKVEKTGTWQSELEQLELEEDDSIRLNNNEQKKRLMRLESTWTLKLARTQ